MVAVGGALHDTFWVRRPRTRGLSCGSLSSLGALCFLGALGCCRFASFATAFWRARSLLVLSAVSLLCLTIRFPSRAMASFSSRVACWGTFNGRGTGSGSFSAFDVRELKLLSTTSY